MVVGLVLCGKVIIDWGPAMMHGLGDGDSIDSRLIDQVGRDSTCYSTKLEGKAIPADDI